MMGKPPEGGEAETTLVLSMPAPECRMHDGGRSGSIWVVRSGQSSVGRACGCRQIL